MRGVERTNLRLQPTLERVHRRATGSRSARFEDVRDATGSGTRVANSNHASSRTATREAAADEQPRWPR